MFCCSWLFECCKIFSTCRVATISLKEDKSLFGMIQNDYGIRIILWEEQTLILSCVIRLYFSYTSIYQIYYGSLVFSMYINAQNWRFQCTLKRIHWTFSNQTYFAFNLFKKQYNFYRCMDIILLQLLKIIESKRNRRIN